MAIGRTDDTKLVGIETQLRLQHKSPAQRRTNVISRLGLVFAPLLLYVVGVGLEVGKRVIRGQYGVRLGIPLYLRDFNYRLPVTPNFRISGIHGSATQRRHIKHGALGNVGVMGDGKERTTGGLGRGFQPVPQILWKRAVVQAIGNKCLGSCRINVADNNAVQVGATRDRAVFPANEGGKFPRGIVRVCCVGNGFPRICLNRRHVGYPTHVRVPVRSSPGDVIFGFRQHIQKQTSGSVGVDSIAQHSRRDPGFCALHERKVFAGNTVVIDASNDTHQLGMIRYHQKIQGCFQLNSAAVPGVHHRRAFGKSVRHVRRRCQIVIGEGI